MVVGGRAVVERLARVFVCVWGGGEWAGGGGGCARLFVCGGEGVWCARVFVSSTEKSRQGVGEEARRVEKGVLLDFFLGG